MPSIALFFDLFKLRIGLVIGFTAIAGLAVQPGSLPGWKAAVLGLSVVLASAAAGAFNQYVERDLDARMRRTRARPFVTGRLEHGPFWLVVIALLLVNSVAATAAAVNPLSAFFVFLGAFFYGVVYTVWLKRRTWWNIVIGGLAGSFAVLAGATAVSPAEVGGSAGALALVLFLWTPPHFWSLAIACREDYQAAGVPMLPVVVGDAKAARAVLAGTVTLVAASFLPLAFGMGWIYLMGATLGGVLFLRTSLALARNPGRKAAMANFHASLAQLTLVLTTAMIDARLAG